MKALIVDDNPHAREHLSALLSAEFPSIELAGQGVDVKSGQELLITLKPDLLFLDIELPDGNGFEVLSLPGLHPFAVIFTTSYEKYAVRAFRFAALDYLTKPIERELFVGSVNRFLEQQQPSEKAYSLLDNFNHLKKERLERIVVPTAKTIELVELTELNYLESDNTYSTLYLNNREKLVSSRPIKSFEELLTDQHFARISRTHLVNLSRIKRVHRGRTCELEMKDGKRLPVSRSRKQDLLDLLNESPFSR